MQQGAEEEHAAREEERQGPTPAKKASSAVRPPVPPAMYQTSAHSTRVMQRGAQRATPPAEKAGKGLRHFSMKVLGAALARARRKP